MYLFLPVSQYRRDGDRPGPSSTGFGIFKLKPVSSRADLVKYCHFHAGVHAPGLLLDVSVRGQDL